MDRRAWHATVHRVAKSQTRLKQPSTHAALLISRGMAVSGIQTSYMMARVGKSAETASSLRH